MKKLVCSLLLCLCAVMAQAAKTYQIQLGSYTLTCDYSEKGGYFCDAKEAPTLHGMLPIVETDDKWDWLQKYFTYRLGETIIDVDDVVCPQETDISIKRMLTVWKGGAHEVYVLLSGNDMGIYFQGYDDISNLPKESIFTKEVVEQNLCSFAFGNSGVSLFGKWFDCNKIEDKKNEFSTTTKFTCKLDEKDPQYNTLFGQDSYLSTASIFSHPKKALSKILKDKDFGCASYKIFSCSQKDVAVGVCVGKEGETFMQATPHGIFTLTNTDLTNSIADKEHAKELCNLTWDKFVL